MSINLELFYYIYLIFVLGFLIFTFFNVWHMIRFGYLTIANIIIIGFYIIVSILILLISWSYISPIDWSQQLMLVPDIGFNI